MTTATTTRNMRWQQFWKSREQFWSLAEQHKQQTGSFPAWVFDFISIHHHDGGYRLVSPICIVDGRPNAFSRPRWEQKTFETLGLAISTARRLAKLYSRTLGTRIHVVYCPPTLNDTKES